MVDPAAETLVATDVAPASGIFREERIFTARSQLSDSLSGSGSGFVSKIIGQDLRNLVECQSSSITAVIENRSGP